MKKILISLLLILTPILFPSQKAFCTDNNQIEKLIKQFKGEKCYWDEHGNAVNIFDSWTKRHYKENCKVNAAMLIGNYGPKAKQALPVLIDAIKNGPNDIDTGDGIIPYRSTVALALGSIQDPAAIPALVKKLGLNEKLSLLPSSPVAWSREAGVERAAIVEALGMFGPKAQAAIPKLEKM